MIVLRWVCFSIMVCLPLGGCADGALMGAAKMEKAKIWLEKVNFKVAKNVNGNSPIAVRLVIIYDDGVMGEVSKMTADQFFEQESQLKKDHANDMDVVSWEVVPGQEMDSEAINPTKAYGKGGFVFARYGTPDVHRESLADEHVITIHLDEKDFYISRDR